VIEYRPVPREIAEEQYLELFADAFPENRGTSLATPEHYRWKYRSPELGAPALEFGAYAEGRLVGYYAALPYPYSIGGQPLQVAMVCDVMTHTTARGKGIFTAQGQYAAEAMAKAGMAFATGYPVRPAVLPGHLKAGWEVMFSLPVFLKLLDPEPLLRQMGAAWLAKGFRPLLSAYQTICRAGRGLPGGTAGARWQTHSLAEFLARFPFEDFSCRWRSQYRNFLLKTDPFLRWRLGAPTAVYCILTVDLGTAPAAVALVRRTRLKGLDVVAALDLMILRECLDAAGAIHDALAAYASMTASAGVALMCTEPDAVRWQLAANGYWRLPFEFKLILRRLAAGLPPDALRDPASWHLMWIDSDDL
jgi:hypothetical protein